MEEKKSEGDGMCAGRLLAVAAASTSNALGETLGTKAMRIAALRPSQIDRVLLEKTSLNQQLKWMSFAMRCFDGEILRILTRCSILDFHDVERASACAKRLDFDGAKALHRHRAKTHAP